MIRTREALTEEGIVEPEKKGLTPVAEWVARYACGGPRLAKQVRTVTLRTAWWE
jgi:hypothetical protein